MTFLRPAALLLSTALLIGASAAHAGPVDAAAAARVGEFNGVLFATSPAEEWRSVWTPGSVPNQAIQKSLAPSPRHALKNGCDALGSVVTELGVISGSCVS